MNDDLQIGIESTWIENNGSAYSRVVVINYFTKDCLSSNPTIMMKTVGQPLRDRIEAKLKNDMGLIHEDDYIFGFYDNPAMSDGKWITFPLPDGKRQVVKLRSEEHFAMMKLHYNE